MNPAAAQHVLMYFVLPLWLRRDSRTIFVTAPAISRRPADRKSRRCICYSHRDGHPDASRDLSRHQFIDHPTGIICLVLHEATAIWDVHYAYNTREVTPTEQHVHSFLEMPPLMGLTIIVILHWGQFLALFGFGAERADFTVRLKQPPLPWVYVTVMLTLVLLFEVLPYLEELARTLRHRGRR